VSTGITFDSLSEAKEYQKRMVQTEQVASSIKREGGEFVVTLLEKKPVKTWIVPRKELEKYKGKEVSGRHLGTEEGHDIWLAEKAGTGTHLHELGHARHGHVEMGGLTLGDRIDRELDAEIYAWLAKDKELNPRVAWNAVRQAFTWNPRANKVSIINEVSRRLEERGIPVTAEDKKWFIDATMVKTDEPEIEEWKESMKEEF